MPSAVIGLQLMTTGCMVGPDYVAPAAPAVTGYTRGPLGNPRAAGNLGKMPGAVAQRFVPGGDIGGRWWIAFESKDLNGLVDEALARNPSLEAAQATLDAALENVEAQKGTLFPSVTGDDSTSYQKAPGGGLQSPLENQRRFTYALFTPRLSVSYAPDIFGGQRRQIESVEARAENERFQLEAAYLTLTTNVVLAAIQEASLREQLAVTHRVIEAQENILSLLRKEVALGQIAQADVVQQEAAVAVSRQALAPLERQLAIQRNLLTALSGHFPSEQIRQTFTLASLRLPTRLPVSLPSGLVEQRPDVRAAAALLHQASADVGVAIANRLPQFKISGDAGSSAITLARLATSSANFYSIAGTVSQPLFDAGTLYHRQRASEEGLVQAQARYKSIVIAAFQNVADALSALQSDADAVSAATNAEKATLKSFDLLQKERVAGASNNLQVLIAQQTYLSALVTAAQTKAARYADTTALFQALGGGWWNRSDVKAPRKGTDFFKFL
ncbi:Histidine kinase (plasmid) [Beijerinckiaceae bacterium RH AL1]|nr:Histidine kinase [Beijerinckiaceae bacterium RH AL1]